MISAEVIILLILSFGALRIWLRFRSGNLLSPVTGLHVQLFVFFGIGGWAFLVTPSNKIGMFRDEIEHYVSASCLPLLLGYAAVSLAESLSTRSSRRKPELWRPSQRELMTLLALGVGGGVLQGSFSNSGIGTIGSYMALAFYPGVLLAAASAVTPGQRRERLNTGGTKWVATILLFFSVLIGFLSPWRSILVVLVITFLIATLIARPKWFLGVVVTAFLILLIVVPFQIYKRSYLERFSRDPVGVAFSALSMPIAYRVEMIGEFIALRTSYTRELAFVERALQGGYPLWEGGSYAAILYQAVPRIVWPAKPELAKKTGYDLPRDIGLLQHQDQVTSWAVNLFAEAAYNFGASALIGFVPLAFFLASCLGQALLRIYRSPQAKGLANIGLFYIILSSTTVIFLSTQIIAFLAIVKIYEMWLSAASIGRVARFGRHER